MCILTLRGTITIRYITRLCIFGRQHFFFSFVNRLVVVVKFEFFELEPTLKIRLQVFF